MIVYKFPDKIWVLNTKRNRTLFLILCYYCYTIILTSATLAVETTNTKLLATGKTAQQRHNVEKVELTNAKGILENKKPIQPNHMMDSDDDEHDDMYSDADEDLLLLNNKSGAFIGASCELTCSKDLQHVICDPTDNRCGCEKNYPVILGKLVGCAKPKKLGEQCYSDETCWYNDANSMCKQVRHNALCQCANGFHLVSHSKPVKRVFCTQDMDIITSDLPTLLGVTSGIAVLAGLICMVLHLFSKTKYPRHRNFGDANLAPPIMYSSDTGIPLTVQSARPSSRSSLRSSGSIGSFSGGGGSGLGGHRRPSSAPLHSGVSLNGSKGVLVSTSRTGSRRPSLASIYSTSSSVRSYSMIRFEKEIQQKEIRQEMKMRLVKLQQNQQFKKPQITIIDTINYPSSRPLPTPSPLTPNSLDELLPSVDETQEFSPKAIQRGRSSYHGPCSSTDAL